MNLIQYQNYDIKRKGYANNVVWLLLGWVGALDLVLGMRVGQGSGLRSQPGLSSSVGQGSGLRSQPGLYSSWGDRSPKHKPIGPVV